MRIMYKLNLHYLCLQIYYLGNGSSNTSCLTCSGSLLYLPANNSCVTDCPNMFYNYDNNSCLAVTKIRLFIYLFYQMFSATRHAKLVLIILVKYLIKINT